MDANSNPTQRKGACLRVRLTGSTQQSESICTAPIFENKMTPEQLWHKWETEPLTPQEEWQLDMDHKVLLEVQKMHPETLHVLYSPYTPAPPGTIEQLKKLFNGG